MHPTDDLQHSRIATSTLPHPQQPVVGNGVVTGLRMAILTHLVLWQGNSPNSFQETMLWEIYDPCLSGQTLQICETDIQYTEYLGMKNHNVEDNVW